MLEKRIEFRYKVLRQQGAAGLTMIDLLDRKLDILNL